MTSCCMEMPSVASWIDFRNSPKLWHCLFIWYQWFSIYLVVWELFSLYFSLLHFTYDLKFCSPVAWNLIHGLWSSEIKNYSSKSKNSHVAVQEIWFHYLWFMYMYLSDCVLSASPPSIFHIHFLLFLYCILLSPLYALYLSIFLYITVCLYIPIQV